MELSATKIILTYWIQGDLSMLNLFKFTLIALTLCFSAKSFAIDVFLYDSKDKGKILGFNKNHPNYKPGGMGELTIPKVSEYNQITPITQVAAAAFKGEKITSLTLPEKLEIIENAAFQNTPLKTVIMPDSITTIQDNAFSSCQLEKVRISRSVTSIGNNAFADNKLTYLYIPKSVLNISNSAFINNQLTTLQFSKNIINLGKSAFENNRLTSVKLPGSLINIHEKTFYKNNISSVTFGDNLQYIGDYAFAENKIKSLNLPKSLNVIGENGFAHNKISELKLPDGFNNISTRTFYDNELKYVHLNLVEFVGTEAFAKNDLFFIKLTSTLPEDGNSLKIKPMTIESKAFVENKDLGTVISEVLECTINADSFLTAVYYPIPSEDKDHAVNLNINGKLKPGKYTTGYIDISFDTNGGGDAPATIRTAKGFPTKILKKLKAEKSGYDFVDWTVTSDKSFSYKTDALYISTVEDTSLKAKWILSIQKSDVSSSEFFAFTRSLALSNVKSSKISKYKAAFKQNWEILNQVPKYFQIVVNAVNEGNDIAICRLNHGWNMISSPIRRYRVSNFIPRHNKVKVTVYKHNGNGSYSQIDDNDILTVGDGYWVYADFSRESPKYFDYKFVGKFDEPEKTLPLGWSLFGPTQLENTAPPASSKTKISYYWDTLANDYVFKNEGDYKVGSAYWLLKFAEDKSEKEE